MTKEEKIKFYKDVHKYIVISYNMIDCIDDIKNTTLYTKKIKYHINALLPMLEQVLDDVYEVEEIKKSNYMNDLYKKFDEFINQYFKHLEDEYLRSEE